MLDALMQPPPVPVPPPSGPELAEWWDVLNALAASFGALGTAGALMVAALAYRRQVETQRRELASGVIFEVIDWGEEGDRRWLRIRVSNLGPLSIASARIMRLKDSIPRTRLKSVLTSDDTYDAVPLGFWLYEPFDDDLWPGRLLGGQVESATAYITRFDRDPSAVKFSDARGRTWIRNHDGDLAPVRDRTEFRLTVAIASYRIFRRLGRVVALFRQRGVS